MWVHIFSFVIKSQSASVTWFEALQREVEYLFSEAAFIVPQPPEMTVKT